MADVIEGVIFIVLFGIPAGIVWVIGMWLTGIFVMRRWHQRTVRALISVIQSVPKEQDQISQIRAYYDRYAATFNYWHWSTSPPRFPVYLENVVFELDYSVTDRFQKVYDISVPDSVRNKIHDLAVRAQMLEAEAHSESGTNDRTDSRADGNLNLREAQGTGLGRSDEADLHAEAETERDAAERRHRQQLLVGALGVIVAIVFGILAYV